MTHVKASCPTCGDFEGTAPDFHLVTFGHDEDEPCGCFYEFICPGCSDLVRKPATGAIAKLLRSGAIPETFHQVPAEAREAHHGEALTPDDLLDFLLRLEVAEYIAALV